MKHLIRILLVFIFGEPVKGENIIDKEPKFHTVVPKEKNDSFFNWAKELRVSTNAPKTRMYHYAV